MEINNYCCSNYIKCSITKRDVKEEEKEEKKEIEILIEKEEIPIFPLAENIKSEVMEIYNGIGNKDKGTYAQFCEYLSEKGLNLKEEQKVFYLIIG